MRQILDSSENPIEIGKTYQIQEVFDSDRAIFSIDGKVGPYGGTTFCRTDWSNAETEISEVFINAEKQWSRNPAQYEKIAPDTEVTIVGFF